MQTLTIGSATEDNFIQYTGTDMMTIKKASTQYCYALFEAGAKIEVADLVSCTGGGATNTAVTFAKMGFKSSCFAKIGRDPAAEYILHTLRVHNIDTSALLQTPTHATGRSFIINAHSGEQTILAHRAANTEITEDELPYDLIAQADHIHISSLSGKSAHSLKTIIDHAATHNRHVSINPGLSQLREDTLTLKASLAHIDTCILNSIEARIFMRALIEADSYYCDILSSYDPNHASACTQTSPTPRLLDAPITYEEHALSIRRFFKEMLQLGPRVIVITDGAFGVYVATEEGIWYHPALSCKVVDTVGAGDAFGSCFIAAQLHGDTIKDALHKGMHNAASVIAHIGAKAGILSKDALEARVASLSTHIRFFPL